MLTPDGPKVLEFNVRCGDPERQGRLPMIQTALLERFCGGVDGKLGGRTVETEEGVCVSVVLSSRGYPEAPEKGKEITGFADVPAGALVFHAGTVKKNGKLVTDGGRVLAVSVKAATVSEAREKVYAAVEKIKFDGSTTGKIYF